MDNTSDMEKDILINAVNCKFPRQNLIEIYYNIGRALPFTAQRFPDGRFSDWYYKQYVEVVRVEPHGKQGKLGKAFGFYYKNGKRADASKQGDKETWCAKDEIEPQPIPCSGCGSWFLIDVLGEMTASPIKVLTLDDVLDFGKYKGIPLKDVIVKDWQYVKWAILESQRLYTDKEKAENYYMEHRPTLCFEDVISFGKYKGKSIFEVYRLDPQYLEWLSQNVESFYLDWKKLKDNDKTEAL